MKIDEHICALKKMVLKKVDDMGTDDYWLNFGEDEAGEAVWLVALFCRRT